MYIFSVYFRIPILYTAYRFGDMEIIYKEATIIYNVEAKRAYGVMCGLLFQHQYFYNSCAHRINLYFNLVVRSCISTNMKS